MDTPFEFEMSIIWWNINFETRSNVMLLNININTKTIEKFGLQLVFYYILHAV